jgi:hypothetical protein
MVEETYTASVPATGDGRRRLARAPMRRVGSTSRADRHRFHEMANAVLMT